MFKVNRIYVEWEKGGQGLISIEETVNYGNCSVKKHTETSDIVVIGEARKNIKSNNEYSAAEYRNQQKKVWLDG